MKKRKMAWRYRYLYLLMLPGLIYLLINNYLPMAGLVIAFKKVNFRTGIWSSPWCGLENFKYLFATKDAWIITRNTILYNLVFIILGLVVSVALAIFLSEMRSKKMRSLHQGCLLIPYIISYVVVSYLVYAFLGSNGLINKGILQEMGKNSVNWYLESKYWSFILVFVNTWKNAGYASVIYLATILGFDDSVYEAARLDGVTPWQKIRYITIPLLKPTIITLTMLNVGRIFYSDFGLFYQVPQNSGAILNVTNVLDTYVYRGLLELGDVSMSSAAGLYQAVVGFFVIMAANALVRKISPDDAII
ncbi:ABC transporter permease [Diplocloster agilis]|uniref:ABC transporter permease n=1 Tax=Diplocloster agilis TaxID=2850323 RepID=UPI0008226823|nr:ABC transporter permease subunit [Suonthocola fibrivorans]MCU6732681.1 ABC transporter permease subunit [Suonthocola fibrivorans]SCI56978.1 Inner membrane ABC transporter permease protein ycjO [uncultured Clostridium sp.]